MQTLTLERARRAHKRVAGRRVLLGTRRPLRHQVLPPPPPTIRPITFSIFTSSTKDSTPNRVNLVASDDSPPGSTPPEKSQSVRHYKALFFYQATNEPRTLNTRYSPAGDKHWTRLLNTHVLSEGISLSARGDGVTIAGLALSPAFFLVWGLPSNPNFRMKFQSNPTVWRDSFFLVWGFPSHPNFRVNFRRIPLYGGSITSANLR